MFIGQDGKRRRICADSRRRQQGAGLDAAAGWRRISAKFGFSCRVGKKLEFDLEAELGELGDEAVGFDLGRTTVEVGGAEIAMFGSVLQHVVDSGQHRGGDGADGFLRTALGSQAKELGFVIYSCLSSDWPPRRT